MKKLLYILRPVWTALLLLLLALAPAMAQTVYKGDTTPLSVIPVPGDTYKWEIYRDSTVNFATAPADTPGTTFTFPGGNIGPSVNVTWLDKGTYFFKVTALNITGCTNNIKIGIIRVKENLPTAVIADPAVICAGAQVSLEITFTGIGPWTFTYTDGTTDWTGSAGMTNPYTLIITPGPVTDTDYWIKSLTDPNGTNTVISNKVTQKVNPLPVPSAIHHN